MYEDVAIVVASIDEIEGVDFDTWPDDRPRFAAIDAPDFFGLVELQRLEAILTGRPWQDIPVSVDTIPSPSAPAPTSGEDLPYAFASQVRRELRDRLAAIPVDDLEAVWRQWAGIEEFALLNEADLKDWFIPFFEGLAGLARQAREEGRDLFVVSSG